jgi:acetylornithine deacetylase/succinyl-diaminopimelate desuccinylase-like protein
MDLQTLCKQIEARKQELFELLSDLVKINSENFGSYGSEEACAQYIHRLCMELELESAM